MRVSDTLRPLGLLLRLLGVGLLLATTSCSGGKQKPVYPVKGKVLFEGRPAAGATVVFHAKDPGENGTEQPYGVVADDGTFELTTYRARDGAPVNQYLVTVFLRKRDAGDDETDLLPLRYNATNESGLTAEVRAGTNDLPAFELTP
jgi:hypothetical protein